MQIGVMDQNQYAVVLNPDEGDMNVTAEPLDIGGMSLDPGAMSTGDFPELEDFSGHVFDEQPEIFDVAQPAPIANPSVLTVLPEQGNFLTIMRDEFPGQQWQEVADMSDAEIRQSLSHLPDERLNSFLDYIHEYRTLTGEAAGGVASAEEAGAAAGADAAEAAAEGASVLEEVLEVAEVAGEVLAIAL